MSWNCNVSLINTEGRENSDSDFKLDFFSIFPEILILILVVIKFIHVIKKKRQQTQSVVSNNIQTLQIDCCYFSKF